MKHRMPIAAALLTVAVALSGCAEGSDASGRSQSTPSTASAAQNTGAGDTSEVSGGASSGGGQSSNGASSSNGGNASSGGQSGSQESNYVTVTVSVTSSSPSPFVSPVGPVMVAIKGSVTLTLLRLTLPSLVTVNV